MIGNENISLLLSGDRFATIYIYFSFTFTNTINSLQIIAPIEQQISKREIKNCTNEKKGKKQNPTNV